VACVLNAEAVSRIQVPNGQAKTVLTVTAGGRTIRAEVNSKSLRRVIATIGEVGPDGVAVVLQGRLGGSDSWIAESWPN